jgi:hypothetical protein
VYYASEALRRAGMTDSPTWVCNTKQLTDQLQKRGWVKSTDSCEYAYVCDNQGNEYGGDAYHERNVSISTPTKDATAYFAYLPQNKISV